MKIHEKLKAVSEQNIDQIMEPDQPTALWEQMEPYWLTSHLIPSDSNLQYRASPIYCGGTAAQHKAAS